MKKEYFTDSKEHLIKTVWFPVRWLSKLPEYRPKHTLIRFNNMHQYAGIYLLQNYSTCFGIHRTHRLEYIQL